MTNRFLFYEEQNFANNQCNTPKNLQQFILTKTIFRYKAKVIHCVEYDRLRVFSDPSYFTI